MSERIDVNQPFLPPIDEYQAYVNEIWEKKWLTNNGELLQQLERELAKKLNIENIAAVSSGTVALQIAINSLDLSGRIITTPFSYVATSSAICWQKCLPDFVDIEPHTFNIDPEKIESAICDQTQAIVATHVFGMPCKVDEIEQIAQKHNLKVIYDAAHCFGGIYRGKSIFDYGDVSCVSFHTTKIFHSIEGGAVISRDPELHRRVAFKRNFGHDGPYKFSEIGINGKMSEFHAAMGLCNLRYVADVIEKRRSDSLKYLQILADCNISYPIVPSDYEPNYAYFPILFETEKHCVDTLDVLKENNIYCRRYFYPALSSLEIFDRRDCPVAESVSKRVLCLPLYYDLSSEQLERIGSIVKKVAESF